MTTGLYTVDRGWFRACKELLALVMLDLDLNIAFGSIQRGFNAYRVWRVILWEKIGLFNVKHSMAVSESNFPLTV